MAALVLAESLANRWATRYQSDPCAFVHDIIEFRDDEVLAPYQDEILSEFPIRRRVAVRGPHGLGKTAEAAWLTWWAVLTSDDVKIPTTASAWRQLTKFLWPEIHKWARRIRWDKLRRDPPTRDELQTLSIKLSATQEAFALASKDPALIEGAHAERVVYIFDESKAIPNSIWDAAEGAFSSGEAYAFAISTPGGKEGRFYDIHRKAPGLEDWWTRHVTLEEAIAAGRISRDWAEARKRQWGEDSPVYQARVLGEFPEQTEDQLISLAWLEAARNRELETGEAKKRAGVDIARFGDDDSVMFIAQPPVVFGCESWHGNDLMVSTGRIKNRGIPANIDEIGVGAGVVDRLREQKFDARGINVSARPRDTEHFLNLRAELYWGLRERFRDGDIDLTRLSRADYDRLTGDLAAIKFTYTSRGQIKIESKEDMKKRLGRSPDFADALMLAFAHGGPRGVELVDFV